MKKILISQKDIVNINSGVPKKVLQEIKTFNELGFKPYAIAEKLKHDLIEKNGGTPIKTFRWPVSGHYRRVFYSNRVKSWADKNRPDLIIGHGDISQQDICFMHNCIHLAYEKINGKKIPSNHPVGQVHAKILSEQKFKLLICNSIKMQNDLCERFNINKEITNVIYPEFDASQFKLSKKEENNIRFRKQFSISSNTIVVGLIVSGDLRKRNLDLLIEVAKKFKNQDIKFVVTGLSKRDQYPAIIKLAGLEKKFIFLPIIDNVEYYFHALDVFVLPAFFEEFGRSALEAMSMKLPVILSQYVGANEILEGKSRDFILEDFQVSTFTNKLKLLIDNKELRHELGNINESSSKKYNANIQNNKFITLIKEKGFI